MKKSCSRLAALGTISCLLLISVASCGITIHPGSDEIAFLRGGTIWVIQPDGTNARALASGDIVGLAWSPDHHSMLYRLLAGGAQFPAPTSTSAVPDAIGDIQVVGINGGLPLQLTRGGDGEARSDAWWNPGGNRLIYREEFLTSPPMPTYVVSQSDQAVGIASKPLLDAAGIPVLSVDGHQVAVVDSTGDLHLGTPGAAGGVVLAQHAALTFPASGRPARVLWQPGHNALLYATANASGGVTLNLIGLDGKSHWSLPFAEVLDADFSPDGSRLLVRTATQFEVFAVNSSTDLFSWPESDAYAIPWWAPDSNRLVVLDQAGVSLVNVSHHVDQHLGGQPAAAPSEPTSRQWWHPATNDPWSADGSQLVFTAVRGGDWQGKQLPAPRGSDTGLYVVAVHGDKVGEPTLIASGAITLPSWTYPDPSTAFLIGA